MSLSKGKMDFRRFFSGLVLAFSATVGFPAAAQALPDSLEVFPSIDTLLTGGLHDSLVLSIAAEEPVMEPDSTFAAPTLEDLLRAKVDSLRGVNAPKAEEKPGKTAAQWLASADSLRMQYSFTSALEALSNASKAAPDSAETVRIAEVESMVRNARSLMGYCTTPTLVASRVYSLDEFILHCPLPDGSLRRMGEDLVLADARATYYSSLDGNGIRNIYCTVPSDTLWSTPRLVNEALTTEYDEINPILSRDGRTLYFASKGLYGMGGYDLYAAHWNRELRDWDTPVNLGFPYSSPYDDYLFYNTDDGRYSVLASSRGCPEGSVCLYVFEYDVMPVRRSISDEDELRRLSALEMPRRASGADGMSLYMERMNEVRILRDSLSKATARHDALRVSLATAPADSVHSLASRVLDSENALKAMRTRLDMASKALQETERKFLSSGAEAADANRPFEFPDNRLGSVLHPRFAVDSTRPAVRFEILGESEFASELPDGLVYQIELAADSQRMAASDMKGMSPVYERMSPNLRYSYCVGLFPTYASALDHLNRVRLLGFRSAHIVAYRNGVRVNVDEVRMSGSETPAWSVDVSGTALPGTQLEVSAGEILR